jgi:hypothetical protein
MFTFESAATSASFRIEEINRRASLRGSLGTLPTAPALLPAFRRRVISLSGTVEVRHAAKNEDQRITRRLREVSAPVHPGREREAS